MTTAETFPTQVHSAQEQRAAVESPASRELFEEFEEILLKVLYSEVLLNLLLREQE